MSDMKLSKHDLATVIGLASVLAYQGRRGQIKFDGVEVSISTIPASDAPEWASPASGVQISVEAEGWAPHEIAECRWHADTIEHRILSSGVLY